MRGFENLGDRIIAKNLKAKDGNKYGVGRYVAIEFDGTPKAVKSAVDQALINTETLKTFVHKISEQDYLKRTMKRLNQEMSPLRDENTKDAAYVRDMWQEYTKNADYQQATTKSQLKRNPEQVYSYLKTMEEGPDSQDAQTVSEWASGKITSEDQKMQNYLIRQYQKKRY